MEIVNIHQAKTQLSRLIEKTLSGQEIIIAKAGKPVVKLLPVHGKLKKRKGGQWKNKVWIADDFDQLPEEILNNFLSNPDEPAH